VTTAGSGSMLAAHHLPGHTPRVHALKGCAPSLSLRCRHGVADALDAGDMVLLYRRAPLLQDMLRASPMVFGIPTLKAFCAGFRCGRPSAGPTEDSAMRAAPLRGLGPRSAFIWDKPKRLLARRNVHHEMKKGGEQASRNAEDCMSRGKPGQ
jgi:hypothetical protein